jgi:N-methylhydantoinase A
VRTIDVHYAGQSFELSLEMDTPVDAAAIAAIDTRFAAEHERTYGHRADADPVEVVHIRVQGRVPARTLSRGASHATSTPESTRQAFFGTRHGSFQTPVIERTTLDASPRHGPLIVEEYDATTLVPPGWTIRRDDRDNLFIQRSQPA